MRRALAVVVAVGVLAGCQDQPLPTATLHGGPTFAIADGRNDVERPGFFFLGPIRPFKLDHVSTGPFDPTLSPVIEVCEWTEETGCALPLVSRLTTTGESLFDQVFVLPQFEEYIALWRTAPLGLKSNKTYRIRVLVGDQELGFADVDVVRTFREAVQVDREEFVPLLKDFILPIRFRIEQGALTRNAAPTLDAIADPAPIPQGAGEQTISLSGITAGPGESQALTVTATSSNATLVPDPTVDYTSPNTTGSLHYTPVADQSGTAAITVTVTDDGGTANGGVNTTSRTFTVTVTPAPVTTVRWINPAGGDWNTPANWSTGALPTATQDVIIDLAVASPVTHSGGTTAIKSLTSNQPFELAGGSLTIAEALQVDASAALTGGSVTTGGNITLHVPGNLVINSVIDAGANAVSLSAGGAISQGSGTVTAGALTLNASTGINLPSTAIDALQVTNTSGAVSVVDATGSLTIAAAGVTNAGAVTLVAPGSIILVGSVTATGATVTLTSTGGTVTQAGGSVNATTLALRTASGAALSTLAVSRLTATNAVSGDLNLGTTGSVTVGGLVNTRGAITLNAPSTVILAGTINGGTGTTSITSGGAIGQSAGTLTAGTAALSASFGIVLNSGSINRLRAVNATSGSISINGLTGDVDIVSGVTNNAGSGAITLAATGNLSISGNVTVQAGQTVSLSGRTISQGGGTPVADLVNLTTVDGATLTGISANRLSAVSTGSGNTDLSVARGVTVVAPGLVAAGGSVTLSVPNGDLIVAAPVSVPGSSLSLSAANVTINPGANVVAANGTITTGALTNQGTLSLGAGGQAVVTGDFANSASAVLRVAVAGSAQFTGVTVSGVATLDGTLEATLVNGFEPAAGDRFRFMTFGSRSGFFATTTVPPNLTVDQADPGALDLVASP